MRAPGRAGQALRCYSTQLDCFECSFFSFSKIHLAQTRPQFRGVGVQSHPCGHLLSAVSAPRSATAGLEAPIRRVFMGRAAREWLGGHGWELFLIVAAAVVSDVVDHLW